MRKILTAVLTAALCLGCFALISCSNTDTPAKEDSDFTAFSGEWECEDNPLNDPDHYCGYLKLEISSSGDFKLYDAEAGNPGLEGTLKVLSENELEADCISTDFDPPAVWKDMEKNQVLIYEFKSEEKLYLTYRYEGEDSDEEERQESTLIFNKVKNK